MAGASAVVVIALSGCGGGASGQEPQATRSCPPPLATPAVRISPSTIYMSVINASDVNGAAGKASTQLTWRGFHVLETSTYSINEERPRPNGAEIRFGKNGKQIALTLATQVKDPVMVQDERPNPTVDLVIGNKFALIPVPPPAAAQIDLNVYNTTWRSGLSGQVADLMRARGFKIVKNGNDPNSQFLPDKVALIRHGERGEPAARRVQLQVKGSQLVQDGRKDLSVDLVLGNHYESLVPEAQATPAAAPKPTRPAGC